MTFTDKEQKEYRASFINECRQMAWSAACHADFIGKSLDELLADYTKLNVADDKLTKEIKTFEHALDSQSKDNRDKRKTLQGFAPALSTRLAR
jgi:hypothetical protein